MHYCPERELVFLHNPKCGGMSVSCYLESIGFVFVGRRDCPHDILLSEEQRRWLVFTTVRDPWERWVSWYRYIAQHQGITSLPSLDAFTASAECLEALMLQRPFVEHANLVIPLHRIDEGLRRIGVLPKGQSLPCLNQTLVSEDGAMYSISGTSRRAFFKRFLCDYAALSSQGLFF